MFDKFFCSPPRQRSADALYMSAVEQARQPEFYSNMGVPDTVDGRFDMIALHVFLILRRLKKGDDQTQATAQALFDTMFTDMDRGLRELGAGDLGVARRVKVMAKAFYGRVSAYDQGLQTGGSDLADAVVRNIFRGDENDRDHAKLVAAYIRNQAEELELQPVEAMLEGNVVFLPVDRTPEEKAAS